MTGGELTLGAVLVRLEEREREITAQAEETREEIKQLTAMLDELGRAAEEVRITRKTLLQLPDPAPPAPSAVTPALPDGAAYQKIMAVFAEAAGPLRARGVCEAMDLDPAPNNINNVRCRCPAAGGRGPEKAPEAVTQRVAASRRSGQPAGPAWRMEIDDSGLPLYSVDAMHQSEIPF